MTTVVVADGEPLQRLGYRRLLESTPGMSLVGEAEHGSQAVRLAAGLRPDVIVMDFQLPGIDGVEATRRIVSAGKRTGVLMLARLDLDEWFHASISAGASGLLLRQAMPDELLAGIRAVAAGYAVLPPRLARRFLDQYAHQARPSLDVCRPEGQLEGLSDRERQVLVAIGQGCTNGEIAGLLGVSESTVKKHVGSVLAKLGARDRIQAVIVAFESGLVTAHREDPVRRLRSFVP